MIRLFFILLFLLSGSESFAQWDTNDTIQLYSCLSYSEPVFNADTCCWRKLASEKKYEEAATLITFYAKYHEDKQINKHLLNWHAGQMFAMAGSRRAKHYMKKTYSVFTKWFGGDDGKTWYYYAKGTKAFLEDDRNELVTILYKWDRKFEKDKNYDNLVRLNNNWGKPYAEANPPQPLRQNH